MLAIHAALFWSLRQQVSEGYSDFAILYTAGQIVRNGLGHHLYDLQTQWHVQRSFSPRVSIRHGPLPYNHAPYEAWIFVPLSAAPYSTAYVIWAAINVAILAIVARLMCNYSPGNAGVPFTLLLFLAFFPVFVALLQGQDSIILLLLYVLGFECIRRERRFLAGLLIALGCFKVHLILPVLVIVGFQKQTRILAGSAVSGIAIFLASAATVGWRNTLGYPRYVWNLNQRPDVGAIKPQLMPNLRGLIDGFLHARLPSMLIIVLTVVISLVLVLVAARTWRRMRIAGSATRQQQEALGFSLAILTTVLVSYHLYAYDATLLLIPMLLVPNGISENPRIPRSTRKMILFVIGTLLFTPLWALLLFKVGYLNLMCLLLLFFGWMIGSVMLTPTDRAVAADRPVALPL